MLPDPGEPTIPRMTRASGADSPASGGLGGRSEARYPTDREQLAALVDREYSSAPWGEWTEGPLAPRVRRDGAIRGFAQISGSLDPLLAIAVATGGPDPRGSSAPGARTGEHDRVR